MIKDIVAPTIIAISLCKTKLSAQLPLTNKTAIITPAVYAFRCVLFNFSPNSAAEKKNNTGTIKKYVPQVVNHESGSTTQNLKPSIITSKKNANSPKRIRLFINF